MTIKASSFDSMMAAEASGTSEVSPGAETIFPSLAKLIKMPHNELSFTQQYMINSLHPLKNVVDTILGGYASPEDVDIKTPAVLKALLHLVDFIVLNGSFVCIRNYLPQKTANKLIEFMSYALDKLLKEEINCDENATPEEVIPMWLTATIALQIRTFLSVKVNIDQADCRKRNMNLFLGLRQLVESTDNYSDSFLSRCDAYLIKIDPKTRPLSYSIMTNYMEGMLSLQTIVLFDEHPFQQDAFRTLLERVKSHLEEALEFSFSGKDGQPIYLYKLRVNLFFFDYQIKRLHESYLHFVCSSTSAVKKDDPVHVLWNSTIASYKAVLQRALSQAKDALIPDPFSIVLINHFLVTSTGLFKTGKKEVEAACNEMKSALAACAAWVPLYLKMQMSADLKLITKWAGDASSTSFEKFFTPEAAEKFFYSEYPLKTCAECQLRTVDMFVCSRCKSVWYCDPECQKKHRKAHKKACKQAQTSSNEASGSSSSSSKAENSTSRKTLPFSENLVKLRDIPKEKLHHSQMCMVETMDRLKYAFAILHEQGKHNKLDFKLPEIQKALFALVEAVSYSGTISFFHYYLPPHIVNEIKPFLESTFASIYRYSIEEGQVPPPEILVPIWLGLILATEYQLASNLDTGVDNKEQLYLSWLLHKQCDQWPRCAEASPEIIFKCDKYLEETFERFFSSKILTTHLQGNEYALKCALAFANFPSFMERKFNAVGVAKCIQMSINIFDSNHASHEEVPVYALFTSMFSYQYQFMALAKGFSKSPRVPEFWWDATVVFFNLVKKAIADAQRLGDFYYYTVYARMMFQCMISGVFKPIHHSEIEAICETLEFGIKACAEWAPPQFLLEANVDINIIKEEVLPFIQRINPADDLERPIEVFKTPGFLDLYTPAAVAARLYPAGDKDRFCAACGGRSDDLFKCFGCSTVWYCDTKCQKKHQKIHTKDVCHHMECQRRGSLMMAGAPVELGIHPTATGGFDMTFKGVPEASTAIAILAWGVDKDGFLWADGTTGWSDESKQRELEYKEKGKEKEKQQGLLQLVGEFDLLDPGEILEEEGSDEWDGEMCAGMPQIDVQVTASPPKRQRV